MKKINCKSNIDIVCYEDTIYDMSTENFTLPRPFYGKAIYIKMNVKEVKFYVTIPVRSVTGKFPN